MDKQKQIVEMFDDIASSYDLANRVLSFGVDVKWRKEGCAKSLERLGRSEGLRVADIACGTGDMILHWQNALGRGCEFVGIDPSEQMLEVAKKKLSNTTFIQAQAQEIPLKSESVDIVSIAYGLRNVCGYQDALKEFYRVLKKGGVLLILEFTHNPSPSLFEKGAKFYTQKILPLIGGLISKNLKAYQYLPNSIEAFASTQELREELEKVGFVNVWSKSYSAKLSTLFLATKE
ncbi:bifunctional demethylmenaquinone methyltransferase/2-methoxy-6-polyprenyl-1,4-benzoquinol methylase UbiE [Helicobacter brantae]|uniref:Demethylmenaquinone methyltransferase n=1 Tax=Helicobacter brantae TaxID=375927 RepID=A0A3D8IZP0_9HELI|nr:bifunctional demethylmenaquinone methyltransferase/2-methoxy-6-polyprenyl-1,4-benzoquinol methylase UbiE [Helicobacter brantae]RDU70553.1 bifunctional demethylmenaquinone methyltransferase/2-methoxy-6-polyprenyl-1,4-benzoquinol methylase UbiE [Helicobacter brantae]